MGFRFKTFNRRWRCKHCNAEGWETYGHIGTPCVFDHDMVDGRRCLRSAREYAEACNVGANSVPSLTRP